MNRNFHLTRFKDFQKVRSENHAVFHRLSIMVYSQNNLENSRAAVVASKKVGNAVTRNRVRRRVRACLRAGWGKIRPGWDLIFYTRSAIAAAEFSAIEDAVIHLLREAGVYKEQEIHAS